MDHLPVRYLPFAIIGFLVFLVAMAASQTHAQPSALAADRLDGVFSVQAQAVTPTQTATPAPAVTKVAAAVNLTPVAQRTPATTNTSVGDLRPGDTVTFSANGSVFGGTVYDFLNANFTVLSAPGCVNLGPVATASIPIGIPSGVAGNATVLECSAVTVSTTIVAQVVTGAPVGPPPPADDPAGNVACPLFGSDPLSRCVAVRLSVVTPTPTATATRTATATATPPPGAAGCRGVSTAIAAGGNPSGQSVAQTCGQ